MPLKLPQSPRAGVWLAIVARLKADKTIASVIRKGSFRAWEGTSEDAMPFTKDQAPALRLTPMNLGDSFATPDSMKGSLLINCEMIVDGSGVLDVLNLWWAICRALYPADPIERSQFAKTLQDAGARSGLVMFTQPAFDPSPDGVFMAAQGQMSIDVEARFN